MKNVHACTNFRFATFTHPPAHTHTHTHTHARATGLQTNGHNAWSECQVPHPLDSRTRQSMVNASNRTLSVGDRRTSVPVQVDLLRGKQRACAAALAVHALYLYGTVDDITSSAQQSWPGAA